MEINQYSQGAQPNGAIAQEDIVESRFVLLTTNYWSHNFGSRTDLPGVKLPDNDTEAQRARYCITFTVPDREKINGMYISPESSYSMPYSLRGGFDQSANVPITGVTLRLTWPGNQEAQTIPSGSMVLLWGPDAVVTIPSGQYVYNSNLHIPGSRLEVLNSDDDTTDHGKLSYAAAGTIAEVVELNDTTSALTVRLLG
jgi:hypothetical protein